MVNSIQQGITKGRNTSRRQAISLDRSCVTHASSAVSQQFGCNLDTFHFGPEALTPLLSGYLNNMANRTKASEQLDEYAKSIKVRWSYSVQSLY